MGPLFDLFAIGVLCYIGWWAYRWLMSITDVLPWDAWINHWREVLDRAVNGHAATHATSAVATAPPSFADITAQLRALGITESIAMAVGIDFTASNVKNGRLTFGGRSLHALSAGPDAPVNPYERVLSAMRVLLPLDADKQVPMFAFGDITTRHHTVRQLGDEVDCRSGAEPLVARYRVEAARAVLDGPTSFAPLINEVAEKSRKAEAFHVLIIICDGQVSLECEPATVAAINQAAETAPLAIIAIGVGDGAPVAVGGDPWATMRRFDNDIHAETPVDNFHFVAFDETIRKAPRGVDPDLHFAAQAFAELPRQYVDICRRDRDRHITTPARRGRAVASRR